MTSLPAAVFWVCIGVVAYAYAGYPLLAAWLSHLRGAEPDVGDGRDIPPMTVIVAAYNEEPRIAARVRDILAQDYPIDRLHVIVVSDGSSDRTAQAAALGDPRVRVLSLAANGGKASALNAGMSMATTELAAFTDARQRYAPGALRALAAAFADPRVGAASGELVIEDSAHDQEVRGPSSQGVGLYWRMETRLRSDEARLHWLHGVSGAVYALRRELFRPMPAGTILDDMWVPLQVVLAGRWVWMARDAIAYDTASANAREEFARKLRTLAGNWQLIARLPRLLNPLLNPVFFAWFSHKFMRLLAPWALLGALSSSALANGAFYRLALIAQVAGYLIAAIGLKVPRLAARVPLLPAASAFVVLNFAALLALPASLTSDSARLWKKH